MHAKECTDLSYRLGGIETPASGDVCLANLIASVTAAVLVCGKTAITRTTVVRRALFVEPVEVIARVRRMGVGDVDSILVGAHFNNLVGDVTLDFATDVHNVQTEDYGRNVNLAGIRSLEQTYGSMGHEGR